MHERRAMSHPSPLWTPTLDQIEATRLTAFMQHVSQVTGQTIATYAALHTWSVEHPDQFWPLAWDFCGLLGEKGEGVLVRNYDPIQAEFFPNASLNVAETFLKNADDRTAIIFVGENGEREEWTRAQLYTEVAQLSSAMRAKGIQKGDRVVGFVANMPQTVAGMLAAASLGAVWSSCSPESGPDVVVDRFGQIDPKMIFATDGYFYNGKSFDTRPSLRAILDRVPSIETTIMWPYATKDQALPEWAVSYDDFKDDTASSVIYEPMGFNDPLYVMFSSGTTGKPKCIEHTGGGAILRQMIEQQMHSDIHAGDRMLYFTTCNWMMWNWQVTALASEATIVVYDGNPMYPNMDRLFDIVQDEKITHFGTSAKYIETLLKHGSTPKETHDLDTVRVIMSTGSPLSPEGFRYVYSDWKQDVQLASICGGTDILGLFIGGCPILPVYEGQITCAALGLDVATLDDTGATVTGTAGELVCKNAHPSMPTRFVGDEGHARYRASYFDKYPNIWRQGDFTIHTEQGGYVVLGRSDATLNPGGVRIGTAEIYRQLDKINEIADAVVVGQNFDNDVRVVLFVTLAEGHALDDALIKRIRSDIRTNASPRHMPAKIVEVPEVPRTKSGKIAELAVRDVVNAQPVRNLSGLANPQALDHFKDRPELRS